MDIHSSYIEFLRICYEEKIVFLEKEINKFDEKEHINIKNILGILENYKKPTREEQKLKKDAQRYIPELVRRFNELKFNLEKLVN